MRGDDDDQSVDFGDGVKVVHSTDGFTPESNARVIEGG